MYDLAAIITANVIFWLALNIFGAAAITSFVPQRLYDCHNAIFKERPFEQTLYRIIRINVWKDKLPIFRLNDKMFDRKRLSKDISIEYIDMFIIETCKAEFVHLAILLLGFFSAAFVFLEIEPLYVFFVVNALMFCVHLPFIFTQRFNRRRLLKLRRHYKK
ncbi:MAG: hypothetical protein LBS19_12580 [Clostridiales bacterium]|jgi:glycosyl-4,4'-diaponeurosporenoate acyltransferase|nr:hypothetical protein [Clostridiales bacterium]